MPRPCLTSLIALLPALPSLAAVTANAGPDQTVPAGAECSVQVTLDASESVVTGETEPTFTWKGPFSEGEGTVTGKTVTVTLGTGTHEVQLTVQAGAESGTDSVLVTVVDVTPPEILSIRPSRDSLWPPNHKLVAVDLEVEVRDNCDEAPECEIVEIESDEPEDGRGDGHTSPDSMTTGPLSTLLRAERSGSGDGRVYTLRVRCRDRNGNVSRSRTTVRVPHDQGKHAGLDKDACRLKVRFDDSGKSRLALRLDLGERQNLIPRNSTEQRKDDLEGYEIRIQLGGENITGIVDAKGRVKTDPARAKWSPAKRKLTLVLRGLDLAKLLELDPGVQGKHIDVEVQLRITLTGPEEGAQPIEIFQDSVGCEYRHKNRKQR